MMRSRRVSRFGRLGIAFGLLWGSMLGHASAQTLTLDDGLVAHWRLDEASGSRTAIDSSGHGHSAAINSGIATDPVFSTTDKAPLLSNGAAMVFRGFDYANAGDVPEFRFGPTDPMSLSVWVKQTQSQGVFHILGKRAGCSDSAFDYQIAGDPYLQVTATSVQRVDTGRLLPLNRWTHIAVTYDGASTLRIYQDGLEVARSSSFVLPQPSSAFFSLGSAGECSYRFSGMIDEVRIYNRRLSDTEVFQLLGGGGSFVAGPAFGEYGGTVTLKAALLSDSRSGNLVTFNVNGLAVGSAITDPEGIATLSNVSIAGIEPGDYPAAIVAAFAGDSQIPPVTATATLTVVGSKPIITWSPPASVVTPHTLTAEDLNASANVPGVFSYSPALGVVLALQYPPRPTPITAHFVPDDAFHYASVDVSAMVDVIFRDVATVRSAPSIVGRIPFGWSLSAPAVDPDHHRIYIAGSSAQDGHATLGVIDSESGIVVADISLAAGAMTGYADSVAVDSRANRVYVVDDQNPLLWVVDGASLTIVETIALPGPAGPIAFDPTIGRLYIGAVFTPEVFVVTPGPASTSVHIIAIAECADGGTHAIAVNPTTNVVYAACGPMLATIDGRPGSPQEDTVVSVHLEYTAYDIAVNRATNLVYVSLGQQVFDVIDGDPSRATWNAVVGTISSIINQPDGTDAVTSGIAVNPVTNLIYVEVGANEYGGCCFTTLTAFDGASGAEVAITMLPVDDHVWYSGHVAVDPSTNRIYVSGYATTVLQDLTSVTLSTPVGSTPITVQSAAALITFSAVTAAGQTTVEHLDPATVTMPLPGQFSVSGELAYEVSTTAGFSGPITICFNAASVSDPATFAALHLLHGQQGAWVDVTTSRDFSTGAICGQVTSLSPFVIARQIRPEYRVVPLFDQTKAVQRGSTVPIKIRLEHSNGTNASSPVLAVVATTVVRSGNQTSGAVADAGNANSGDRFRYDPVLAGYVFNLSTKSLGIGTYELKFVAGLDTTTYSVRFEVR